MKAFHGSKKLKARYLSRVRKSAALAAVAHAEYVQDVREAVKAGQELGLEEMAWTPNPPQYRGAGRWEGLLTEVGLSLGGEAFVAYERRLGIPRWLGGLENWIFEGTEDISWPARLLTAITVGQDLEAVKAPFLAFAATFAKESAEVAEAKATNALAMSSATRCAEYVQEVVEAEAKAPPADAHQRAPIAQMGDRWLAMLEAERAGQRAPQEAANSAAWAAAHSGVCTFDTAITRLAAKLIALIEEAAQ
jgi:hypothetical protein